MCITRGVYLNKKGFSYYDIEQFLREAGAEKINEKAIVSFEEELESTVKELANEAVMYAKYAGRNMLITDCDVDMVNSCGAKKLYIANRPPRKKKAVLKKGIRVRRTISQTS
jgi:histone H3/H4